jgi:hypothetical protein
MRSKLVNLDFRVAIVDAKRGDHFLQTGFSGLIPLYLCSGFNVIQDQGALSRVA